MLVEDMLRDMGADVIGPASTLDDALRLAEGEGCDVALLDVNMNGQQTYPVAAVLKGRSVPCVFATGYGDQVRDVVPDALIVEKPYDQAAVERALLDALGKTLAAP